MDSHLCKYCTINQGWRNASEIMNRGCRAAAGSRDRWRCFLIERFILLPVRIPFPGMLSRIWRSCCCTLISEISSWYLSDAVTSAGIATPLLQSGNTILFIELPRQPRPVACQAQLVPSRESKGQENQPLYTLFALSSVIMVLLFSSCLSLAYLRLFFCVQVCATNICWWIKLFTQGGPKKPDHSYFR